ncbi:hypothetical protein LguiB_034198 [Lonicera macranthoides]
MELWGRLAFLYLTLATLFELSINGKTMHTVKPTRKPPPPLPRAGKRSVFRTQWQWWRLASASLLEKRYVCRRETVTMVAAGVCVSTLYTLNLLRAFNKALRPAPRINQKSN